MLGYMFANIKHAMAQDVYIGNDKGCEVYIVTDTIQSDGGTMANVSTKYVKNGKFVRMENWYFQLMNGWIYQTQIMFEKGVTSIVDWNGISGKILEYCLSY